MTLGQKVRDLRNHRGLSQESLADLSKTSLKTIQRVEQGISSPRSYTLNSICQALEVEPESLRTFKVDKDKKSGEVTIDFEIVRQVNFASLVGLLVPFGNVLLPIYWWKKLKPDSTSSELIQRMIGFQVMLTVLTVMAVFLRPVVLKAFVGASSLGDFPTSLVIVLMAMLIDLVVLINISTKLRRAEPAVLTSLRMVF